MMKSIRRLLMGAVALLMVACDNAGVDLGFPEQETNVIVAHVFLDRDGSRSRTVLDTVYAGARVALIQRRSGDTVQTAVSDNGGLSTFRDVALGEYAIAVAAGGLGDTLQVATIDSANLTIRRGDDTTRIQVRLGYPELSVRQARAATAGKTVFLRGVVLAGVQSFRDTTSHLADSSGTIRLTNVVVRGGLAGNVPGDSVTVLGVIASRLGQPTLDHALIGRFGSRPAPLPTIVTTAVAASANAGALDAGLVQVVAAAITDTVSTLPDFKVVVNDASGPLTVMLDANIQFPRTSFIPGRRLTARGVLVPDGNGGWSLKPRDLGDATVF